MTGNVPEGFEGGIVYSASKTEAEKAAWKWVEEKKPNFVLNTVLPNFNVSGPLKPLNYYSFFLLKWLMRFSVRPSFNTRTSVRFYNGLCS